MLTKMGLLSCAETKCGNQFVKGLSGGQKRRLSLAIALLKKPAVIFLDEPTSGLDAAASAGVMKFVTDIAAKEKLIILCTIHQPSAKVFHGFDQVMLLSAGKVAYCGKASLAEKYFEGIGHKM